MDVSSGRWLSELDMEEPTFIEHFKMDSPHDYYFNFHAFDPATSAEEVATYNNNMGMEIIRPVNERSKNNNSSRSCTTTKYHVSPKASPPSSSSQIISFGNLTNSPLGTGGSQQLYGDCCTMKPKDEGVSQGSYHHHELNQNYSSLNPGQGTEIQRQDHVFAERMRREKLSQRFIALTALIPNLKKVDKATVLGEAAKYLKQLEERVKTLEEQTAKKVVESVVFVKRARLSIESDHDNSSSDENFDCKTNQQPPLPEIEARVSDKNILIRIHCEKHRGYVAKILSEIEKLHLTVTNSSALPFGNHAMDITVVAQMDTGYCMTVKDLVKNLKHILPTKSM